MPRTQVVTRFDFRAAGASRAKRQELFAPGLEQAAYVDTHGHDALMLSEHHTVDDGYLPRPIPPARPHGGAQQAEIGGFRLSAGRVSHTIGLGYRRAEYALFDRPCPGRTGEIRLVACHPGCGGLPAEPSWESGG